MDDFRNYLKDYLEVWPDLTMEQQNQLVNNSVYKSYAPLQMLKTQDSGCLGLLLVLEGEIRVYMLSDEGKEITLYRLNAGEVCIFSSMCVLNQINFDVFIECMSPVKIIQVNTMSLGLVSKANPIFENFLLHLTIDRFNDVMWSMQQILFKSMDVRLATFLLDEVNNNHSLELQITHETIAKYVGSAREVISRTLKYFESEKLVKLKRGYVIILDKNRLLQLINQ